VRRYRLDDYRGRYRLWLWSAGLSLAMSIDTMADLRGLTRLLAVEGGGWIGPLGGDLWWLCPVGLLFTLCGLRMALDMRGCRAGLASLLFALASLASGVALAYIALPISDNVLAIAVSSCWLAGCWLLFFAHVAFARHVLLDAHGQLPVRAEKPKREKKTAPAAIDGKSKSPAKPAEAAKRDDLTTRIDPPHNLLHRGTTNAANPKASLVGGATRPPSAASPALSKTAAGAGKPASASSHAMSDYDDDEDDRRSNKMSRAERKKLRKQQRAGRYGDDD
jgi:hypothetical protein